MNLANVGESMKKVDNSDWICMIQPREDEDEKSGAKNFNNDVKIMDCKVTKSRFGEKDFSIPFKANFSRFRFEELRKDSGLDIDENLQELSEKNKVADHITQIQNSRYMDEDESFNMDGFV